MRVVNTLLILVLAHLWMWPGNSSALDDFDMDALFEGMDEFEESTEPENDWDEAPVEEAEPVEEEPAPAPVEDPFTDDLFDFENDFADDWADEPADPAPAPVDEPVMDDLSDFEDDFADDWADEPADPAPAPEPVQEPAEEPDPMDDLFFFDDDPMEEPIDEPVMDEPEEDIFVEEEPEPVVEEVPVEDAQDVAAREEIRRQAAEINGLQHLDAGFRALDQDEFQRARSAFEVAIRDIPDRPATRELRERARWGLAESHYRIAQDVYRQDGDMRVARQNAERALELSPGHRGVAFLQRRIAREEARRLAEEARPVPVERRPEIREKRENIDEMMREGRAYYEAGELDRAELLFESVLVRDEYHVDAMRYLRRISEDKMAASNRLRETTTAQMIQQVRDAWNPPRRDEVLLPADLIGPGPTDMVTPARRLQEKMEAIIIPRIEFRQANIRDVISFLRDASEAADPDREGVNIILNMSMPEGARAPAAPRAPAPAPGAFDDPWGDDDPWGAVAPSPEPAGVPGVPTITLNLRRISLMEAIRYITEVAGLRYRIEDNVVVITPAGIADVGRVITRLYPVQPSFLDVVQEREGDAPPATGFGEFGARRTPTPGRGADVKSFFEGAGVPFPAGTSITYNPTISQLIVANTPENLDKFERILSQLNVVPNQVEIEARFVEVAEEDMQELGLQWLFTDNYEFMQRTSGGPFGGRERVQVDAGNVSRGMRFFGTSDGGTIPMSTATTVDPTFAGNILSISSVLTNPEMRVVLHALSQSGNVDLLSAPRVTTRSGVNASIEVVTEIIYPTEFRVTEPTITAASGASGSAVISPPTVTPDNFETRRTGVILNVTPTVGPDGYTIDLALAPEVAELVDWLQYGSRLRVPNPEDPTGFQEFVYNIPQPVFASRNVTTSIVIWDGQTVVMGGLMRERLITIQDKIPILGDIPLLGRLFRTEGSRSRKENLLIFVTARLVDPAGKPIHRADAMTMPGMD